MEVNRAFKKVVSPSFVAIGNKRSNVPTRMEIKKPNANICEAVSCNLLCFIMVVYHIIKRLSNAGY